MLGLSRLASGSGDLGLTKQLASARRGRRIRGERRGGAPPEPPPDVPSAKVFLALDARQEPETAAVEAGTEAAEARTAVVLSRMAAGLGTAAPQVAGRSRTAAEPGTAAPQVAPAVAEPWGPEKRQGAQTVARQVAPREAEPREPRGTEVWQGRWGSEVEA